MTMVQNCPKCGEKNMKYALVYTQRPQLERIGIIAMAIILLIGPLAFPFGEPIYRYLAMIGGGITLYGSFSERYNIHRNLKSVGFECNDCRHHWEIEIEVKDSFKKWPELSPSNWRRVIPGRKIPELEN